MGEWLKPYLRMKYKTFKEEMRGKCRKCINEQLGVHFKHQDCEFWDFPEECVSCKAVKNIVTDIKFIKRHKLWFKKVSKAEK